MRETLVVFKRGDTGDERRNVYLAHGKDEKFGSVDFLPCGALTLGDLCPTLSELQASREDLLQWVPSQNEFDADLAHSVEGALKSMAHFLENEIVDCRARLAEMSSYGMTAWIDADEKSYFELVCHEDELSCEVEVASTRVYIGTLELVLVYHSNIYYAALRDVCGEEVALFSGNFPEISKRGTGLQLKTYAEKQLRKLSIWHVLGEEAEALKSAVLALESKESKESEANGSFAVDEARLWGKSKEAFKGGYTQTYIMMRAEQRGSVERRAFFRYGQWCYGGCLDMDHPVNLAQVPHVLRKFQKQQGRLGFLFEVKNLPKRYHFTTPMKHLAMAVAFLEEEIGKAEPVLSRLNQQHARQGMETWIDEENGQQYFELQTAGNAEHYKDVELMASKTYFQEVVLIVLYFEGSFYVTLSPSIDDQPLLDMSFPDVSTRGRAFQIATYNHPEFKKLMLWQAQKSVWETANRAVLEQRKKEAEAKAARRRQIEEERNARRYEEVDIAADDVEAKISQDDELLQESKTECREASNGEESKCSSTAAQGPASTEGEDRKVLFGSLGTSTRASSVRGGAKARHHLKPLDSASYRKIQKSMPKLGSDMDAPWDARGRPKALFSAD